MFIIGAHITREESIGSVLPVTAVQLLKSQHLEGLESDASVMNSGLFFVSKPVRRISLSE